MSLVSVRDLRNHGGDVLARVERGEVLTVTRAGRPVAELRPLPKPSLTAEELLERCRRLPEVDPGAFRRDIDVAVDTRLW
jgi:prevent-host-death family protein